MIVLDNDLYAEYYKFKHPELDLDYKVDIISGILRFAGNSVLTNWQQWNELKLPEKAPIAIGLRKNKKQKDLSLTDLAKHTYYKIVLTADPAKTTFPYVNINGDDIQPVVGGFILRNAPRHNAVSHLNALCAEAKEVILYDNYFSSQRNQNIATLLSILPAHPLKLIYDTPKNKEERPFDQKCIDIISPQRPDWQFGRQILKDHHDRYLVIDNKIEIILTSGFDHLSRNDKEISYIIRKYNNRF